MIYTIEKANLIIEQLRKFKDSFSYQLAGHYSNIDFWLNEVKESLRVIDDYNKRFKKMSDSQKEWIKNHDVEIHDYCPICNGKCEFSTGIPSLPQKVENNLLKETRKNLVNAAYYFLIRGYKSKLIDEKTLKVLCEEIGTSIDPFDIK